MEDIKLLFMSDTHTMHRYQRIPEGVDISIHSGDALGYGTHEELNDFCQWFKTTSAYPIYVAGNHDVCLDPGYTSQASRETALNIIMDNGIHYLEDAEVVVHGLKIYGSPWTPSFMDWAFQFNRNSHELEKIWAKIPNDTDILVTHGPPHGRADYSFRRNVGCELLRKRVDIIKPKIHAFGHVHAGAGVMMRDGTLFINAACLDELYDQGNHPFLITTKELEDAQKERED